MLDDSLFLRSSARGSLTATETGTSTQGVVDLKRTPMVGMACAVFVPKQSAGDTVRVKLQHSTDDTTYTDLVSFDTVASITVARTTSAKYVRRFATEYRYVRYEATVAGTSPDYGAVVIAIGDRDQWNTLTVGDTLSGETL